MSTEALRKLEEHGRQFMHMFDDYESGNSEPEIEEEPVVEEEEEIVKQLTTMKSKKKKAEPVKKLVHTVPNLPKNVTIFVEPGLNVESIQHKSLDGNEEQVAVTARDKKILKRKRHEEETQKQLELSQEIKKFKKGPGFDAENNPIISRKNERQREMDQLAFDMKKFVYSKTLSQDEYDRKMDEEYKLQGKFYERDSGRKASAPAAINLKEYREKKKQDKLTEKERIKEAKRNGTFDKKKHRIDIIRSKSLKQNEKYRELGRHGAPNDIGKADKRVRSQFASGSVGTWKNGTLFIGKRELHQIKNSK